MDVILLASPGQVMVMVLVLVEGTPILIVGFDGVCVASGPGIAVMLDAVMIHHLGRAVTSLVQVVDGPAERQTEKCQKQTCVNPHQKESNHTTNSEPAQSSGKEAKGLFGNTGKTIYKTTGFTNTAWRDSQPQRLRRIIGLTTRGRPVGSSTRSSSMERRV